MTIYTKESLEELRKEIEIQRVCCALGLTFVAENEFYYDCPFCGTEHFSINTTVNNYFCFHCQAKGDAVELLMNGWNQTFDEAIKFLSVMFDVALEAVSKIKEKEDGGIDWAKRLEKIVSGLKNADIIDIKNIRIDGVEI